MRDLLRRSPGALAAALLLGSPRRATGDRLRRKAGGWTRNRSRCTGTSTESRTSWTSDEAAAWYALGYEEARDGLWEIQKVVKVRERPGIQVPGRFRRARASSACPATSSRTSPTSSSTARGQLWHDPTRPSSWSSSRTRTQPTQRGVPALPQPQGLRQGDQGLSGPPRERQPHLPEEIAMRDWLLEAAIAPGPCTTR